MKKLSWLSIVMVILFNGWFPSLTQAQNENSMGWKLSSKTTPLLEDHLRIKAPEGAMVNNSSDMSILSWEQNKVPITLIFSETYEKVGTDTQADLLKTGRWQNSGTPKVSLLAKKDSLEIYQGTPGKPETFSKGSSPFGFEILTPQKSLISVTPIIKTKDEEALAQIKKDLINYIKMVQLGSRKLNFAAREVQLDTPFPNKKLSLMIPENFRLQTVFLRPGVVKSYQIFPAKMLALGDKNYTGSFDIRLGNPEGPSDMDPNYKKIEKTLFGEKQTWWDGSEKERGVYLQMTSYPASAAEQKKIYITLSALTTPTYEVFNKVIESMKLVESSGK